MESNVISVKLENGILTKDNCDDIHLQLIDAEKDGHIYIITDEQFDSGQFVCEENPEEGIARGELKLATESALKLSIEENTSKELYACYNCNVTFASVDEHIQNFHKGQEVVIESNEEDQSPEVALSVSVNNEISIKEDTNENKLEHNDKTLCENEKYMIIDAGVLDESNKTFMYTKEILNIEQDNEKPSTSIDNDTCVVISKNDAIISKQISVGSQIYYCINCSTHFDTIKKMTTHSCHSSNDLFNCTHCSVKCNNAKALITHMLIHKNLDENSEELNDRSTRLNEKLKSSDFKCRICMTIFPSNKSLQLHKRMHEVNVKAVKPSCMITNQDGDAATEYYHCVICKMWINVSLKSDHDKSHDAGFICSKCNRKFKSEATLSMHVKIHTNDKVPIIKNEKVLPYQCNFCDRQFSRPHEKVKHERIHTGEKPYMCEVCNKTFRVSYCLTLHLRTHTDDRPYTCKSCGKKFKSHGVYNHHVLTHSDVRSFKCTLCPKAFKTAVQLAGHRNSHTKPFVCTECNRPFASLYAVKNHMSTHKRINNLKFRCHICGAIYARFFALKDHHKEQHGSMEVGSGIEPETDLAAQSIMPKDDVKVTDLGLGDSEGEITMPIDV